MKTLTVLLSLATATLAVLNGQEAPADSYRYLAYIDFSGVSIWHCTGTLISPNYVLTSAICTSGATEAIVTLGTKNIIHLDDSAVTLVSSEILTNDGYLNADYGIYDNVGLIKLPEPVTLNEHIQVVKLPLDGSTEDHIAETARVVSWGPTESEVKSGPLLYAESITSDIDDCEVGIYGEEYVHPGVICLASENGGACGDVGAPLIIDDVQIGVYSFVIQGCYPAYHSGFQRISTVKKWIVENSDLEE